MSAAARAIGEGGPLRAVVLATVERHGARWLGDTEIAGYLHGLDRRAVAATLAKLHDEGLVERSGPWLYRRCGGTRDTIPSGWLDVLRRLPLFVRDARRHRPTLLQLQRADLARVDGPRWVCTHTGTWHRDRAARSDGR